MRSNAKSLHRQRIHVDAKLEKVRPALEHATTPRSGWLRAIRGSLGMSAEQLGRRLGVSKQTILQFERNEVKRTLSLGSLEKVAKALGCQLVYAVVPDETLDAKLEQRAKLVARRKLKRVGHSMSLEAQDLPDDLRELQVNELAKKLKDSLGSSLWDDP